MKKILPVLLVLLALILTSCDAFVEPGTMEKPKLYFIGIGLDYRTWNRRSQDSTATGYSYLGNTRNDLIAVTAQFEKLAQEAGYDYRFITYDDFSSYMNHEAEGRMPSPYGSNYNFMFRTWTNGSQEKKSIEYMGMDIAGEKVSLRSFAEEFTDYINDYLTLDGDMPGKNDIIIFYYTGHGLENGLGPALYYQTGNTPESKWTDPSTPFTIDANTQVDNDDFIIPLPYVYLDELVFDKYESTVITLFDCCYSGYAINNSSLGSIHNFETHSWNQSVRDDQLRVPSIDSIFTNTYLATFSKENAPKNRYHVTAAHATQTSFDKDFNSKNPQQDNFGAFTYQLLDYLDYDFEGNSKSLKTLAGEDIGSQGEPTKKIYSVSDLYTHIFNNIGYDTKTYATPNVTRSRFDLAFFIM